MTHDPLLYQVPLPYRGTFHPMGFTANIGTNCETIIAAAESAWGKFQKTRNEPAVELRLAVSESLTGERPPARMPRAQGHLVSFIHDAENFAICDLRAGFGYGWLTDAVAGDQSHVGYHFVENCVLMLLEALYMTPVHAASVSLSGQGVLLCGNSGAGKTTLSYACAKRGWTYAGDDSAHLIRKSENRLVLANPYQIRFRPHAMTLFPELAGNATSARPSGKPSIELDTAPLHFVTARETSVDYLVFLNRTTTDWQRLAKYDREAAYASLSQVVCYGDESLRDEMRSSLERLLTAPVFELYYHDLTWAEQRLRSLVETGE